MLVKLLGGLDVGVAVLFILITFGIGLPMQLVLAGAGLLFLKGMFIFTGEIVLSIIDLFSAALLVLSLIVSVPFVLVWIAGFLLLAKGIVSFM